jgi:hypothetical protein
MLPGKDIGAGDKHLLVPQVLFNPVQFLFEGKIVFAVEYV